MCRTPSPHYHLPSHCSVLPAELPTLHCEFSYFRKFNTKWQMNANYTSMVQLKPEMLSTGFFCNPSHYSCAYRSNDLLLVPRVCKKSTALPKATPHVLVCVHTVLFLFLKQELEQCHHGLQSPRGKERKVLPERRENNGLRRVEVSLWAATLGVQGDCLFLTCKPHSGLEILKQQRDTDLALGQEDRPG